MSLPTTAVLHQDTGERANWECFLFYCKVSQVSSTDIEEVEQSDLVWFPRQPVPDVSPKPQASPCDPRKDLALRRTGERPLAVCVCDGGETREVKASKVNGDFLFHIYSPPTCNLS